MTPNNYTDALKYTKAFKGDRFTLNDLQKLHFKRRARLVQLKMNERFGISVVCGMYFWLFFADFNHRPLFILSVRCSMCLYCARKNDQKMSLFKI